MLHVAIWLCRCQIVAVNHKFVVNLRYLVQLGVGGCAADGIAAVTKILRDNPSEKTRWKGIIAIVTGQEDGV